MSGFENCVYHVRETYFDECGGTVGQQCRAELAAFALVLVLADSLLSVVRWRIDVIGVENVPRVHRCIGSVHRAAYPT